MRGVFPQDGFTLVELVVTIAVMAIIAMMAAPSFNNMLLKQNLDKSAQTLISTLGQARSQAALRRQEITVQLSTVQVADTNTQLNWIPSGKAVLRTGSSTSLIFLPNGLVKNANSDTSFVICEQPSGSLSKTVSISKMGTIQQTVEGTCS